MRATSREKPSLFARFAALAVGLTTTAIGLAALPAAYFVLGTPIDGRVAAISVVAGIVAGLLAHRKISGQRLVAPSS